jgi:hypothetical protein
VLRVAPVDFVDERRHRRRLSRAGRTADEHKAMMETRHLFHLRRKAQLGEQRRLRRKGANRRGCVPALAMEIHAKAPESRPAQRHIGGPVIAIPFERLRVEGGKDRGFDGLAHERRLRHGRHDSIQTNRRRKPGDEKQIGRAARNQRVQPSLE